MAAVQSGMPRPRGADKSAALEWNWRSCDPRQPTRRPLGLAGAGGGTAVAFSTRAMRFERAVGGFCQLPQRDLHGPGNGQPHNPFGWSSQP